MRIIHTCLRYPPASGGAERYVWELVERTRRALNADVRVLTSKLRTHHPMSELDPPQLLDDAPYVQRLHHAATPFIAYPRLQALRYYLGHHQPNIIHGYGFWYQPADVASRFAKQHKIPFIFHPLYYRNAVRQKLLWQIYQAMIGRATFAAADAVIVISPHEQRLIEQAGLPVKRFIQISPGIDVDKWQARQSDPYAARSLTGHILLMVSRLAPGKGLDEVIAALPDILKVYPDTHLAMVGEDFGAKEDLQREALALGLGNRVHFLGALTDQELAAAYQHADIFVHPSHYEAFGIVLAEALAAKTPIVARRAAAVPYVVPANKAGLLFTDQEELVRHIIDLLSNEPKRSALADGGFKHVAQNFTWDQSIKKLVELYNEFGQDQ